MFAAITRVEHDKKDKTNITKIMNEFGRVYEVIDLVKPVKAQGNIEDWLNDILREMRRSLKRLNGQMAQEVAAMGDSLTGL